MTRVGHVEAGVVSHVVDGDTIDVTRVGRIRIVGIDTPERGRCGYAAAQELMDGLVLGRAVTLTAVATKDDVDRYGRLLRYVDVGGVDAGLEEIRAGYAVARYDSRDGYGAHPRELAYIQAEEAAQPPGCAPGSRRTASSTPRATSSPSGTEPWNAPGPDLDCADIGKRVRITGRDYHRLDRDGDGWGCESYPY